MLSEEKIKLMTSLAMYEKNHGKEIFPVMKYFKTDYISSKMFRSFFCYTISFILGIAIWVFYRMEAWMNAINVEEIIQMIRPMVMFYLLGLAVYLIITYLVYFRRYNRASKGIKTYTARLKKLEKQYTSRNRTRVKEGGYHDESSRI